MGYFVHEYCMRYSQPNCNRESTGREMRPCVGRANGNRVAREKHRLEKEVNKKNWKKPSVLRNLSQPDLEHLVTHTLLRIASVSNESAQSELNECARSDQNRV